MTVPCCAAKSRRKHSPYLCLLRLLARCWLCHPVEDALGRLLPAGGILQVHLSLKLSDQLIQLWDESGDLGDIYLVLLPLIAEPAQLLYGCCHGFYLGDTQAEDLSLRLPPGAELLM